MKNILAAIVLCASLLGCAGFPSISHQTSLPLAASDPEPRLELKQPPRFSTAPSIRNQENCFSIRGAAYYGAVPDIAEKLAVQNKDLPKFLPGESFDYKGKSYVCYRFIYEVDGTLVEGHVVKPADSAGKKLPAIIYNRGGNDEMGMSTNRTLYDIHIEFARKGFVVISSQYRGALIWPKETTLNIGKDEFGGRDVDDVKALIPILDGMAEVDGNRIGMFGISRGGMMTYMAAKNNPRIKTIVVWAGVSDHWGWAIHRTEMEQFVFARLIPDYASNKEQVLRDRSVIYWLDQLDKNLPVLLLHGDADDRVLVDNSIKLAAKLKARGQVHKLIVYPKADHGLNPFREQANEEIAQWFGQWL